MPTIEPFADVAVATGQWLAWLESIPRDEWAGMSDPAWHNCDLEVRPPAERLVAKHFPGCVISGLGLFLLAAGQKHPAHTDEQPPEWVTRVHIPLVTNPKATATTDDGELHMQVGKAYRFNTRAMHAVHNGGDTPRVHLVFDVKRVP